MGRRDHTPLTAEEIRTLKAALLLAADHYPEAEALREKIDEMEETHCLVWVEMEG